MKQGLNLSNTTNTPLTVSLLELLKRDIVRRRIKNLIHALYSYDVTQVGDVKDLTLIYLIIDNTRYYVRSDG